MWELRTSRGSSDDQLSNRMALHEYIEFITCETDETFVFSLSELIFLNQSTATAQIQSMKDDKLSREVPE
jgi:hypothetical protein